MMFVEESIDCYERLAKRLEARARGDPVPLPQIETSQMG